jgi:hypothetical protein
MTYIDPIQNAPKLPHLHHLQKSNPNTQIHIIVGKDSGRGKYYDWKNSDQQLRLWLKENFSKIDNDIVAIIEWDTLITQPLPQLPDHLDLASRFCYRENIKIRGKWQRKRMADPTWTPDNWWWWPETQLMGLNAAQEGVGLVSMGFYLCRRHVLGSILNERWDEVYERSIQNELRLPTIAHLEGARVGEINLPYVRFDNIIPLAEPGIYHGVENKIL